METVAKLLCTQKWKVLALPTMEGGMVGRDGQTDFLDYRKDIIIFIAD